jgi:hypothetical protein
MITQKRLPGIFICDGERGGGELTNGETEREGEGERERERERECERQSVCEEGDGVSTKIRTFA